MKQLILIIGFVCVVFSAQAQSCKLQFGYLYTVYVFSKNTNHTIEELMGEKINPMFFNIIIVKTERKLSEIKKLATENKLQTAIFIFPKQQQVMRYCNQQEFGDALKNNVELRIEE